jgi:hypothetical protein
MAAYKGPLDYIDVATRIVEFREKYPDGRLRQKDVQFIDFAGKSWVVFTAEAWRTEDDPAPAHGTAWEPVPGPTQFTRDSELQNAETAAWGRAMVAALAVDTKKGIASQEEVRNRGGDVTPKVQPVVKPVVTPPAEWRADLAKIHSVEGLQAFYEADAHAWFTDDVKAAFTAKKEALTNG